MPEMICANAAVNNILSAYTRKARSEGIEVKPDVEIGKNLMIPSIIRSAEKYGGEYDFKNNKGVFVFRLLMDTRPTEENVDDSEWR